MMDNSLSPSVAVVGGLNLDICATPDVALRPRDSTPGRIALSSGGVGHNIARNLAAAGVPTELFTLLGDDESAAFLQACCAREGVGLSHAVRMSGRSCSYACIHDISGDMAMAINDMALFSLLTPAQVEAWLPVIRTASLCVADANPPQEALEALAAGIDVPLLIDPVSCFKADRLINILPRIEAIKPNEHEAAYMTGEHDPARAAAWFLRRGVRRVFISLGAQGVYFADAAECGHLPAAHIHVTHCTGAGDAMTAGIALGLLAGASTRDCAILGQKTVSNHLIAQGGVLT